MAEVKKMPRAQTMTLKEATRYLGITSSQINDGMLARTFPEPMDRGGVLVWPVDVLNAWIQRGRPMPGNALYCPADKLYLIVDAQGDTFKIGVSNDPSERWKDVCVNRDHNRSYVWECGKGAYRAERVLHILFSEYSRPRDGDGGTEWFDIACLEDALRFLRAQRKRLKLKLMQGV